jgi:hypothetical protein
VLGLAAASFVACGPDRRPEEPCYGPSFNLLLTAEDGPLPADTRIKVRYGGDPEGELYELGKPRPPQAVSCHEDTNAGGAPSTTGNAVAGEGGTSSNEDLDVWKLRCGLYTQGAARLDATATGYEPIMGAQLSFLHDEENCEAPRAFVLVPLKPDAGK